MRKRHNLRRMNNSVGCAFVLFVRFECIILASRPFGYPNGSLPAFAQSQRAMCLDNRTTEHLVRDALRPTRTKTFNNYY